MGRIIKAVLMSPFVSRTSATFTVRGRSAGPTGRAVGCELAKGAGMGEHEADKPNDDREPPKESTEEGRHPTAKERTMFEVEDEELA